MNTDPATTSGLVAPLAGRTVVVCGGTSGIGRACARRVAELGAVVAVIGRDQPRLEATVAEIGEAARGLGVDLTDADAAREAFDAFGAIDHLVVSLAGGAAMGPFLDLDEGGMRSTFEGKFWPYITAMREGGRHLTERGSMTLVTGASAIAAVPGAAPLGAVNGAIEGMVKTLAVELAPRRVNAVSPGLTDTEAWSRIPDAVREQMYADSAANTPVGRIGRPEDVADAVVSLMLNGFLTGLVLPCDGGKRLV